VPGLSQARRRTVAAWDAWRLAAGPWARWSQCLPLLGPGLDELGCPPWQSPPPARGAERLVASLKRRLSRAQTGTMALLDLPPTTGVRVASALAAAGVAHPLLQLGRWPYADAVLPARPLVDLLVVEAGRLGPLRARHVVVVVDGERARPRTRQGRASPLADNRFPLDPDDLPHATDLQAGRVTMVLDVRRGLRASPGPPPDAYAAYAGYVAAGLTVVAVRAA